MVLLSPGFGRYPLTWRHRNSPRALPARHLVCRIPLPQVGIKVDRHLVYLHNQLWLPCSLQSAFLKIMLDIRIILDIDKYPAGSFPASQVPLNHVIDVQSV